MKRLLNYLPLLTICMIYFGFNNLYGYYIVFGVDIYNYITSTEVLMSFFPTLLALGGYAYSISLQSLISSSEKKEELASDEESEEDSEPAEQPKQHFIAKVFANAYFWFFFSLMILTTISYLVQKRYEQRPWALQQFNLIMAVLGLLPFLALGFNKMGLKLLKNNRVLLMVLVLIFIGDQIRNFRQLDAVRLMAGNSILDLSFVRNGKQINTDKTLMYVGQTQNHLFLYDRKSKNTIILKQSEIDSLVVKRTKQSR